MCSRPWGHRVRHNWGELNWTDPSQTILKKLEDGTLPNSFYKANDSKARQRYYQKMEKKKKRKLQVIIFDAHKCKYFQENISKLNPIIKSYYDDQVEFIPESQ